MPSLIAIDLGSHAVKATVLVRSGRRWVPDDRFSAAVPQDGTTVPGDEARFAALDTLLDDHPNWRAPSNEVVAMWPAGKASMHRLVLPFTDKAQVQQTLPFTVEGEVPFDMDEMVLGHRILAVDTKTSVLAVMARHEDLGEFIGELRERSVDPARVYVDADMHSHWAPREGTVAIVDVGHARTLVSVVRDGVVEKARAIDVGGRDFTAAIQRALNCSWAYAQQVKHGQIQAEQQPHDDEEITEPRVTPTGDPLPPLARRAVDQAMGLLLAEVRSTLITSEDALKTEVESVLLTGGGARLYPLQDYLQRDLGVAVAAVTDRDGDPVPPEFGVADAAAMVLAGSPTGRPVDLRIDDLAFKGGVDVLRAVGTLMTSGVIFLSVAAVVIFAVYYRDLGQQQADMENRIRTLVSDTFPDVPPAAVSVTTSESIMAEKLRATKEMAAKLGVSPEPPTVKELEQITKAFPPHKPENGSEPGQVEVNVSDLSITKTNIVIKAETDGYTSSATVEESLKKNPRYARATSEDNGKRGSKVRFTVTIPLGDETKEEGG